MKELGISDRDLALYCHISEVNIPGYRSGERLPNIWYLVLMAEYLECSVNDLLGFGEIKCSSVLESQRASYVFSARNPFEDHISKRIAHYMILSNTNIEMLSEHSGVSQWTIKSWLGTHPRLPRTIQFLYICDALKCTPSDLLGY